MAASPTGDDAELLAMEVEIMRLRGLMKGDGSEAAWAFARSYRRDDAIDEAETFHLPADRLCERLRATPALTQAARLATAPLFLITDFIGIRI
jgi:hypothetical protein